MIDVISLALSYSDAEDRLELRVAGKSGPAERLHLTRRLVRQLLRTIAEILLKSSTKARKVSADASLEIVIFEHEAAMAARVADEKKARETAGTPGNLDAAAPLAHRLVSAIKLRPRLPNHVIELHVGDEVAAMMTVQPPELHRLLASLDRCVRQAEWGIEAETGWLLETRKPNRISGRA